MDCSSVLLGDLPGADIVKGTGTRIARLSVEADIKKTLRGFNLRLQQQLVITHSITPAPGAQLQGTISSESVEALNNWHSTFETLKQIAYRWFKTDIRFEHVCHRGPLLLRVGLKHSGSVELLLISDFGAEAVVMMMIY